jgi:hypothetical protein
VKCCSCDNPTKIYGGAGQVIVASEQKFLQGLQVPDPCRSGRLWIRIYIVIEATKLRSYSGLRVLRFRRNISERHTIQSGQVITSTTAIYEERQLHVPLPVSRECRFISAIFWPMSTTTEHAATVSAPRRLEGEKMIENKGKSQNYKGFVAGVFSGIAKLSGEYPIPLIYLSI